MLQTKGKNRNKICAGRTKGEKSQNEKRDKVKIKQAKYLEKIKQKNN
jgi:hypothetical protein